uniref:Coiled-coil domain-containing protein 51 n=1 Tax=Globodera rostochiensis TaxID=31243 RepID=A0A914I9K6_GLORO
MFKKRGSLPINIRIRISARTKWTERGLRWRLQHFKPKPAAAAVYKHHHQSPFIGLTEVHKARDEVNQCEHNLYLAQQGRREKQTELNLLQSRLRDIHSELDRTQRGEDRYLHLLTEEHAAIKRERELLSSFELLEAKERDAFNILSNKVRISHEREREREERTKYWSLTGSLLGAFFGIFGTTIVNEVRMRHIREMIPAGQELRPLLGEMAKIAREGQENVVDFLEDLKNSLSLDSPKLSNLAEKREIELGEEMDVKKSIDDLKEQNDQMLDRMGELKRLIHLERSLSDAEGGRAVAYIGDDMAAMLHQTEQNIEARLKLQTLVAVVGFYAALVITLPLIYFYFSGAK